MSREERKLGWAGAIWNALINRKLSYYPRFVKGNRIERIEAPSILEEITAALQELKPARSEEAKSFLDRGRETLNEVKALTEYQDAKATRLLTIIAFLSALSGVMFGRFADSYPWKQTIGTFGCSYRSALVAFDYLTFAVFILAVVSGALVTFHATKTQFKYPEIPNDMVDAENKRPGSYLFYSGIIELKPREWANSFTKLGPDNGLAVDSNLALNYFKNYIAESYLIACKVADKLRYLQPAQSILSFSIRVLLVWLLLFGMTSVLVPATKPSGTAMTMK